jgi:hypothetical protein
MRNRFGVSCGISVGMLLAGLLAGAASATQREAVWGQATFGMTEKSIQEAYGDDLRASKMNASAPTTGGAGILRVTKFYLLGQTFEKLDRCRVEFTFYQNRLSIVGILCFGKTQDQIYAVLEERYGPPGFRSQDGSIVTWNRSPTLINYNPITGLISIADEVGGSRAYERLMEPRAAPSGDAGSPEPKADPPGVDGGAGTQDEDER